MDMIPVIAILGGILVVLTPIVLVFVLLWKLLNRGRSSSLSEDEMRLVQQVHNDLGRMEKRVESLESILIEKARVR